MAVREKSSPHLRSNSQEHINPGRTPMHAPPGSTSSESWLDAWDGHELSQLSLGRSASTIRNRKCVVMIMAKSLCAEGITDPCQLSKLQLNRYLLRQYDGRKPGGRVALFATLRVFFSWLAEEYEVPDPMAGIPRPRGSITPVPVVKPEDIGAILKACEDRFPWLTARNTAIIWLMLESGLRRFEITSLDLADVDLRARTVQVRRGKAGKARISVFGDDSAQAVHRYIVRYRGKMDGPLFLSEHAGRLTPSGLSQITGRISSRSGIKIRPHMLRHTWAHENLASGMIGETDLLQLGGWSSSDMLRRYGAVMAQERAIAHGRAVQVGQRMKAAR